MEGGGLRPEKRKDGAPRFYLYFFKKGIEANYNYYLIRTASPKDS